MEVLKLVTESYILSVQTSNPKTSWRRFKSRMQDKAYIYCDYISSIPGKLWLYDNQAKITPIDDQAVANKWEQRHPVFFETNTYNFAIEFFDLKGKPSIIHPNKMVADLFSYFPSNKGGILTGSVNFINEPGKFTLSFTYDTITQQSNICHFTFDVISPKLDTKEDYKSIVETINKEYNELVFKYLTLTFQQFGKGGKTKNELIWLAIFQEIIGGYIRACDYIVNKPHFKMKPEVHFKKPDKIKRWSSGMEEKYKEKESVYKDEVNELYFRNEQIDTTIDTKENRFVKYTILQLGKKLQSVIKQLEINYSESISDEYKAKLESYRIQLDKLIHRKMFRVVGKFEGFKQESIVLQKRTGYAQVYRYWLMLKSGLTLFEGTTNIGMKQIWELYELWCFLKMKEIIGSLENIEQLGESKDKMFNPFTDSEIEHCITFKNTSNEDIIELLYQHTYNRSQQETHTATTEQRPDIVLNIKKASTGFVITYLYDAKYRVWDDLREGATDVTDEPVPDAINQMHRYRDAIYYGQNRRFAAKEVIGAYVLFPGRGNDEDVQNSYYQKSIDTINIGAFPLLPNSEKEREGFLLKKHLRKVILDETQYEQISNSIPQKGLIYGSEQNINVFVGVVKPENKEYQSFKNRNAKLYYTGRNFPSTLNILSFKFFAPYYKEGIREYYEIIGIRSATKSEIDNNNDQDNDGVRFFFELGTCKIISEIPISVPLINHTYNQVTLKELIKRSHLLVSN